MRFVAFALLCLFLFPVAAAAQEKYMQIELADDRVNISTGFNGASVVVFGTVNVDKADVVVNLKGPEHTMVVRRKDALMGAWMNHESVKFRRVPSYYDYNSTLAEDELSFRKEFLRENQIGVENLGLYADDDDDDLQITETFHDALIRRMQEKGFYPLKAGTIRMIDPHFFKAVFELPPGVPTGVYTVEAILLDKGMVLAKETKTFQVGQVGFNARIYLFAQNNAFFYGLFAVLFAFFSGWSAFTFLRRD